MKVAVLQSSELEVEQLEAGIRELAPGVSIELMQDVLQSTAVKETVPAKMFETELGL